MLTLEEITIEIIQELVKIQKSPRRHDDNDDFESLRALWLDNRKVIRTTKRIDQLISDFARKHYYLSALKNRLKLDEYRKLVRRAFGPALEKIDIKLDTKLIAQAVLSSVLEKVLEDTEWISRNVEVEYAFACTLFHYDDFKPLQVGPVQFEPREAWLERKSTDGCYARVHKGGKIERFNRQIADGPISKFAKRRILRLWNGEKLRSRKPSYDSANENDVVNSIGDCRVVCSVKVAGLGDEAGKERALLAARLALTAISLIWEHPSNALEGMNLLYDEKMRVRHLLLFTSDGLVLGGRSRSSLPYAMGVDRQKLSEFFGQHTDTFAVTGEAIQWLIDPDSRIDRREIWSVFAQSMLWFHDGCRELSDLKALVSFASCLDILASGGGRSAILKLINSQTGIDANSVVHRDGRTLKDVVDEMYDDGRTRYLHGPMRDGKNVWENKLVHDWSGKRQIAENLARVCLVSALNWVAKHPNSTDPKEMQT